MPTLKLINDTCWTNGFQILTFLISAVYRNRFAGT
jgi:hypothetical protein